MSETLQLPALQVQAPGDVEQDEFAAAENPTSPSPSLRRKRFKMRRMKHVQSEPVEGSKEYLQLPSIEITPSSDEDAVCSGSSTPSASPCRRRSLLKKWLRGGDKKEQSSESSSQQSSLHSSHEDDTTRYLSPNAREDSTASNSNRSTPTCSPVLRKRSRSPLPPSADGENMVEKSSEHSSEKSPSTPEQSGQRPYSQSVHGTRTGNKNSKKSADNKEFQEKLQGFGKGASMKGHHSKAEGRCDSPAAENKLVHLSPSSRVSCPPDWFKSSLVHIPLFFSPQTFSNGLFPSKVVF
ncbi:GRAM domain-containing protein 1B [Bagarius yarrelli]|uniref:GRAM domain-containing protein 1B n=1 Tax=Bagarius yarrelli TaxID=175774 RepID=A0A556V5I1_BAGYA|nr:GRAM domain-containing protein 1B [Bagarius yarrelli]